MNLAETIRKESEEILNRGGAIVGQCLTAVGWVNGTVPEIYDKDKVIELPMTEAAGMGFSVGLALSGRTVIHIIRFQSFLFLQSSPLVFYANLAKELWDYEIPLIVRAIGDEGWHGPVHSNCYHSMFADMGIDVFAPMTPKEYTQALDMAHDRPMLISEHRHGYRLTGEWYDALDTNTVHPDNKVVIVAISATRIEAIKAREILNKKHGDNYAGVIHLKYLNSLFDPINPDVSSMVEADNVLITDASNSLPGLYINDLNALRTFRQSSKEMNIGTLTTFNAVTSVAEEYRRGYPKAQDMIEWVDSHGR
jgi:pyruvate/2-oxoglutarate/acetoin dehydrogenase E1 component